VNIGLLQGVPAWATLTMVFVALLTGALAVSSALSAFFKFFPVGRWIAHYHRRHAERGLLREYIPQMTAREREIIAWLLHHNQTTIITASDGGYAMPLISHRILIRALQPGQVFDLENTPFVIPDHLWAELEKHRAAFPYEENDEGHPWRIPWQLQ
jgi:hypothetical protein